MQHTDITLHLAREKNTNTTEKIRQSQTAIPELNTFQGYSRHWK